MFPMRNVAGLTTELPVLGLPSAGTDVVHDEQTFRYLLELERRRTERSNGAFLLLLVESTDRSNESGCFARGVADRLFSLMAPCLRETDFLGWHDEGRVAAAVLTHLEGATGTDALHLVTERITRALHAGLSPDVVGQLTVRVRELPLSGGRS
jgi:hypothetical protein